MKKKNKNNKKTAARKGSGRGMAARAARKSRADFPAGGHGPVSRGGKKAGASGERLTGTVQGTGKGYAFFIPDDGSGDLFIPASALGGAMHGDRAEAVRTGFRMKNGECRIERIISRGNTVLVGVFDGSSVVTRDRGIGSLPVDLRASLPAKIGDKVVAKPVYGPVTKCAICEVLGREGDNAADLMGIMRSYSLPESFPPAAAREAEALPSFVDESAATANKRKDFRADTTVTIDGETSKDFDDAVCAARTKDGGYRLWVHIADVAEYVKEGSALDAEAMARGTSVYFADRVIPMLPEKLSNGICSLNEGEDRLTLSCVIDYDADGNRLGHFVTEGVIRSKARMTYGSVEKILCGDKAERAKYDGGIVSMLDAAAELARILENRRVGRGMVDLEIPECEIDVGENCKVLDVRRRPRLFSHKLVEEFMLEANETVAEHFRKCNVPFVFRVHEQPPAEKVEALNDFLAFAGLSVPDRPAPKDIAELIRSAPEKVRGAVSRVALRSMAKADYRPECLGHFGLAAQFYCHFTSPIRRYPDLAIHRIIKYVLRGGKDASKKFGAFAAEAARQSSERERIADEAERRADDLLKARFMEDKIGERYAATISGVTEWGLFAELDNGVEGLLRTDRLPGTYTYDEKRMALVSPGRTFAMGDRIEVVVEAVNYDKTAFALAE